MGLPFKIAYSFRGRPVLCRDSCIRRERCRRRFCVVSSSAHLRSGSNACWVLRIVHCCTRNWLPCHYALSASVALWTRRRPSVATPKCGGAPPTKSLMHRLMTFMGLYRLAQLPEWSLSGPTAGKCKALSGHADRRQEDIGQPLRGARYTRGAGRALAHKRMSMTRQSPIQLPIG